MALARLDRLELATLRRRLCHKIVEQTSSRERDLVDRALKRLIVRTRGAGRPADLPDKLHGGRANLVVCRRRVNVVKHPDVAAHAATVALRPQHEALTDAAEGCADPDARRLSGCEFGGEGEGLCDDSLQRRLTGCVDDGAPGGVVDALCLGFHRVDEKLVEGDQAGTVTLTGCGRRTAQP